MPRDNGFCPMCDGMMGGGWGMMLLVALFWITRTRGPEYSRSRDRAEQSANLSEKSANGPERRRLLEHEGAAFLTLWCRTLPRIGQMYGYGFSSPRIDSRGGR